MKRGDIIKTKQILLTLKSILYDIKLGLTSKSEKYEEPISSLYKNQYESKVVKYHTEVETNVSVKRRKRY